MEQLYQRIATLNVDIDGLRGEIAQLTNTLEANASALDRLSPIMRRIAERTNFGLQAEIQQLTGRLMQLETQREEVLTELRAMGELVDLPELVQEYEEEEEVSRPPSPEEGDPSNWMNQDEDKGEYFDPDAP